MNFDTLSPPSPLLPLMRTVWLQVVRRKDMYLLAFVMLLFTGGTIAARAMGADTTEMVLFIGSLGYTLSNALAGVLSIIVASRLIPAEIENRTVYPVLAKPVSRLDLLLGRFLPAFIAAALFYSLCCVITFAVTPHLLHQSFVTFFQFYMLGLLSLAMLTAMMICCSLAMPSSVAMVLGFLFYFAGGAVLNALTQSVGTSPARWLVRAVPDFSLLNHIQRYLDGAVPLSPAEFSVLLAYGGLWTALFGSLAFWLFHRRPL